MKEISSIQYGERMLRLNRVVILPVFVGALISTYLVPLEIIALVVAALGGAATVLILVAGWKTSSIWHGGLFGVAAGAAVMVPLLLFPNHQEAVLFQMFVSWLWVFAGMSLALLVLSKTISKYLHNGI